MKNSKTALLKSLLLLSGLIIASLAFGESNFSSTYSIPSDELIANLDQFDGDIQIDAQLDISKIPVAYCEEEASEESDSSILTKIKVFRHPTSKIPVAIISMRHPVD